MSTDRQNDKQPIATQDPTRSGPAGSRTETKIAEESGLASDNAVEAKDDGAREPAPAER